MNRFQNANKPTPDIRLAELRTALKSAAEVLRCSERVLTLTGAAQQTHLRIEQRSLTWKTIQTAVWRIWGINRDNRESLDSEKFCTLIQATVEAAVADVARRAENLAAELDSAQRTIAELKKENRRLGGSMKVRGFVVSADGEPDIEDTEIDEAAELEDEEEDDTA